MILDKFMNSTFLKRLISGIILVIIALVTIIAGGDILLITVGVVSLVGLFEMNRVFHIEKNIIGLLSYICAIGYYVLLKTDNMEYTFALVVFFMMALLAVYVFQFPRVKTESIMAAVFGMIYVVAMLSFIYIVRQSVNGLYSVWLVFLCSWGSDTCAYVFGVAFGKHKMAPVLSPKKSMEGAVGGVFGAAVLGLIYACVFRENIVSLIDPRISYPIICAMGSLVAMTGDLAASAVKRNHKIKDYGTLIPGHGGIMDRFDSVIITAPLIYYLIVYFG